MKQWDARIFLGLAGLTLGLSLGGNLATAVGFGLTTLAWATAMSKH